MSKYVYIFIGHMHRRIHIEAYTIFPSLKKNEKDLQSFPWRRWRAFAWAPFIHRYWMGGAATAIVAPSTRTGESAHVEAHWSHGEVQQEKNRLMHLPWLNTVLVLRFLYMHT